MARLMASFLTVGFALPPAVGQERAPDGRSFGELLRFVGLEGVSVEVNGITGVMYNVPGQHEDPAKVLAQSWSSSSSDSAVEGARG